MKRTLKIPLSLLVALLTALVTGVSMAIYAVVQYYQQEHGGDGAHGVMPLVLEHGWHVIALGLITYGTLYVVLDRVVVKPIRALYVKLYAVARGDLAPTPVHSRVAEIQEMADGINMMLGHVATSDRLKGLLGLARHAHLQLDLLLQAEGGHLSPTTQHHLAAVADEFDKLVVALQAVALTKQKNASASVQ